MSENSENVVTLSTKVILAKNIKMDRNYRNVLDYSESQMLELLRNPNNLVSEQNGYSYIEQNTSYIYVGLSYSTVIEANYVAFNNELYKNKWIFGFIDSVIYINENTTRINYTLDIWSTYFKSLSLKTCFVEREHVNDDTIGKNVVDENLNVGEVICEYTQTEGGLSQYHYVGVFTNWNVDNKTGFNGITVINGNVVGKNLCLFRLDTQAIQLEQLLYFILQTNADGHISDLSDMFIIPYSMIEQSQLEQHTYDVVIGGSTVHEDAYYYTLSEFTFGAKKLPINVPKHYTFNNFIPKNNKCYCFPFNYLYVTNNVGSRNILKYEEFSDSNNATFEAQIALTIGCSGRLVPKNYKHILENIDESIPLAKYPTCGWSSDSFTNWLTSQAVNIPTKFMNLTISAISAASSVSGNIYSSALDEGEKGYKPYDVGQNVSIVGNLANQVASIIGDYYQATLLPEITGGESTGDVNFSNGNNTFKLMCMRSKDEFMKKIDDYFTKFGYKVSTLKVPNITGRQNFNYIQIAQTEKLFYGNIPHNYLEFINSIAVRGTTIWHNHTNLGNYTVNNSIIN